MNKKKIFKLLFFPLTLLLCLSIFVINSFASQGWEQQENGDIKSLNLIENGENVSGNNVSLYFNCSLNANTTYSFKLYGGNNSGAYSLWSADSNNNFIEEFTSSTGVNSSITFTTTSNCAKIGIYPNNINNTNLMLNEGSSSLDYFPYGVFYTTPQQNNFIKYLIGDNYFSGGRASITQTTNNTYWDRQISNSNLYSGYTIGDTRIGNYIVGDTIYIENLTYDLVEGLKATNRYNFNYFTYIHLKPSLNFATSSVEYLAIQCKYVNLTIYAPNSSYTVSAYVGNSSDLPLSSNNERIYFEQLGDYINISFDNNDTRYLWDIEIVLNRSDNNFISPQNIISNTDSTISWDMYNIGFDDGVNSMQMKYNVLESDYNDLVNQNNALQSSINTLREEVDNLQNALENNFGFRNVFFALADTPFKTASNMLGFELFGVNLFNALIGFITVLACIWLLKKFL